MSDPLAAPAETRRPRTREDYLRLAHKVGDIACGNESIVDYEHNIFSCEVCARIADVIAEFLPAAETRQPSAETRTTSTQPFDPACSTVPFGQAGYAPEGIAAETLPRHDRLDLEPIKARLAWMRQFTNLFPSADVEHFAALIQEVERLRAVGPRREVIEDLLTVWEKEDAMPDSRYDEHEDGYYSIREIRTMRTEELRAALRAVGVPAGEKK